MATSISPWLQDALFVSLSDVGAWSGPTSDVGTEDEAVPDDPGKQKQFRKLAESVLFGRRVVNTYNLALIAALLIFTTWHWGGKLALHRRKGNTGRAAKGDESVDEAWSSSSSTIEGTRTPPDAPSKKVDVDETSPLLSTSSRQRGTPGMWKPYYLFKAFMQYQPRNIPIINRTLPTNATSLLVLAYIALNIVYNFYGMTYELMYIFSFADRCGLIFSANLPLLYLLAAKNQPLKFLTGHSYESLNIFHRRVGELMCFEAFLHFAGKF